jgi:hypothetical protein
MTYVIKQKQGDGISQPVGESRSSRFWTNAECSSDAAWKCDDKEKNMDESDKEVGYSEL